MRTRAVEGEVEIVSESFASYSARGFLLLGLISCEQWFALETVRDSILMIAVYVNTMSLHRLIAFGESLCCIYRARGSGHSLTTVETFIRPESHVLLREQA